MNKILKWIGLYEEQGKLKVDWRQVYFIIGFIVILSLFYDAIFVYPLNLDGWGLTSPYFTKLIFTFLAYGLIYFGWGYMRLVDEVNKLKERLR